MNTNEYVAHEEFNYFEKVDFTIFNFSGFGLGLCF